MPAAEFDELRADIAANGQLEEIVTQEGLILDGRHRARLCQELGLVVRKREWAGECGSPLAYVLSQNLRRRHLTSSQRAMLALRLLPELERQARERQAHGQTAPGRSLPQKVAEALESRDLAATIAGTNRQYISDAKKLAQEAPDLAKRVALDPEFTIARAKVELKDRWRESRRAENRRLVETTVPLDPERDVPTPTIVLDPPWDHHELGDHEVFLGSRPTYAQMSLADIAALPIPELTTENAHIYLWLTTRLLAAGKGWELLEGWGFRPITAITWCKPTIGVGCYYRNNTEHVLFGVRGSLPLLLKNVGTHFAAVRSRPHSAKPGELYRIVEGCSPGPWREMFVRGEPRPGWHGWGAEKAT